MRRSPMEFAVSPELYRKHKDAILQLSLAIQNYDGKNYTPQPLTDEEIAKKLGITVKEVREIRCIAEVDVFPSNIWMEADIFKNERAKKFLSKIGKS